jgi:lantibiotic biosynthesis protein
MGRKSNWEPILEGLLADSALESIRAIATDIIKIDPTRQADFLLSQSALLFAYLARMEPSGEWQDRAVDCLNLAIEQVSASFHHWSLGLYGGLSEVGWTIEHVTRVLTQSDASSEIQAEDTEDSDAEDPIAAIDELLNRCLEQHALPGVYDLISGLVGLGVYCLERLPRKSAVCGIEHIVRELEELAERSLPGLTWFTPPEQLPKQQLRQCPSGYYNLGVAHGVPGIVSFLSQVVTTGVEARRAQALLESSVEWLMAQQRPPQAQSRYSYWCLPGQDGGDSRLAWCYGDLGIAATLLLSARLVAKPEWETAGTALMDRCVAWPVERAGVCDAPLCHGALGVAHIFNRAYQDDGNQTYRNAARVWFEHGLAMRQPGKGVGGFFAWKPEKQPNWDPDPSFLSGSIGIALALLSAIYPVEPEWDRLLLLSSRSQA